MLLKAFSFVLLLAAAAAAASSTPPPASVVSFPALDGLGRQEPIAPRTYAHSFAHTDWRGRSTKLEYKTEVSEHVYHLHEMAPQFQITACNDNDVVFSISGDVSAASGNMPAVGKLLSGDLSAGCKNSTSGKGMVLQRRITGVSVDGNQVTFATTPARLNEMLKHAKVQFKSNAFQGKATTATNKTDDGRRDFLSWLGDTAVSAFNDVVSTVEDVGTVASALVTGDYQTSTNLLGNNGDFSFNYNPSTQSANQVYDLAQLSGGGGTLSLQCSNCFATFSSDLEFSIDIESYSLNTMAVTASATAEVNVEITLDAQIGNSWQGSTTLATITGPTVVVDVGIPVSITIDFPLQAGYQASFDASVTADAFFNAQGSMSFGVSYANGAWGPVQSQSFQWSSGVNNVGAQANGNVGAYLIPGISIAAYESLSVGIGLIPFVSASVSYNSNGVAANSAYDVEATADYGLNVEFDAGLSLAGLEQVASWTSPQYNIITVPFLNSPYFFDANNGGGTRKKIAAAVEERSAGSSSASASSTIDFASTGTCNARTACNNAHGMLDCASQTCICSDGWTGATCNIPPPKIVIAVNSSRSGGQQQHQLMSVSPDRSAVKAAGFCPSGSCAVLRAEDVKTCSHLAGQPVCMPLSSQTVAEVDAAVGAELQGVSKVGPRCIASMRHQLCSLRFPLCTPSTARMNPMCFSDCVASYQACDLSSNDATALCVAASGARNGSSVAPSPQHMSNEDQELCAGSRSGFAAGSNRTCVIASELKTCTHLNGRPIALTPLAFATPALADAHVASLMQGTFASESCRSAALAYRCSQFMPVCGGKKMNDPHFPVLLSRDTCLSILSGCELPSIVNRACNGSSALWVNDTVAPAFMASSYALQAEDVGARSTADDGNNVLTAGAIVGIAVGGVAFVSVVGVMAILLLRYRSSKKQNAGMDVPMGLTSVA